MHGALVQSIVDCLDADTGLVYLTCFPHTGKTNIDNFLRLCEKRGLEYREEPTNISEPIAFIDSGGQHVEMPADILNQVHTFILFHTKQ